LLKNAFEYLERIFDLPPDHTSRHYGTDAPRAAAAEGLPKSIKDIENDHCKETPKLETHYWNDCARSQLDDQ
jgi:hypothetical protein